MRLDGLTDFSTGVVVKVTGPNSMSCPGPDPVFRSWPTAFNVTCRAADPFTGRLRTRIIGRVWANEWGTWSAEVEGVPELRVHVSSKAAVEAVKRDYRRRGSDGTV